MINKADIEDMGFLTWLQFYEFLQFHGHTKKPVISIVKPVKATKAEMSKVAKAQPGEYEWTFNTNDLKALVFDELYSRLPRMESVDIVHSMVADFCPRSQDIHSFLNNLATRKP